MISLRHIAIFILAAMPFLAAAQAPGKKVSKPAAPKESNGNKYDENGKRNGIWTVQQPGVRGEEPYTEYGTYDHGLRLGPWYRIDNNGDLVSIENFRFDVRNGEVQYFERGKLVCQGNYRGLNPTNEFDTIPVADPVTGIETLVTLPAERGSVRHGSWKYYDGAGKLVREEEYQADDLIASKDFKVNAPDSAMLAKREQEAELRMQGAPSGKKHVSLTSGERDDNNYDIGNVEANPTHPRPVPKKREKPIPPPPVETTAPAAPQTKTEPVVQPPVAHSKPPVTDAARPAPKQDDPAVKRRNKVIITEVKPKGN